MRSGLFALVLASGATIVLGGCVQATRHSNTMVFGTNTTFGIKVGTATGETPKIVVGYDRQEAVIMPLVANTSSVDSPNLLKPCDMNATPTGVVGKAEYAVHPCSLVAFRDGAQDSYSVLASFGAEFSANASAAPEASGGLAQYFATGMAAQILALKGGAALVATGRAAGESAKEPVSLSTLFPGGTSFARSEAMAFDNSVGTLRARIRGTSDMNVLARKTKAFLVAVNSPFKGLSMATECTDQDKCLEALTDDLALLQRSGTFETAVSGWESY